MQGECAYFLRGGWLGLSKWFGTWVLCREKKDCEKKKKNVRIRLGNEKETDAEDTTHDSGTRTTEGDPK